MVAAASAAAVCFGAAAVGGMIFKLLAASEAPVAGLLLALGARITAPLAACVVIHLTGGPLAEAGFAIWTLVFYPVALAVSTWSEIETISRSHSHAGRT